MGPLAGNGRRGGWFNYPTLADTLVCSLTVCILPLPSPECSRQGGCGLDVRLKLGGLRAAALICLSAFRLIPPLAAPDGSHFTAPPQFLETPPQVLEVQELEPVTLRCVARGSPQPHVTWKLQGQDLGQGHGQMQVKRVAGQGAPDREYE